MYKQKVFSMLNALLKRYNHHRKEKYFQSPLFHSQKNYAFIGFGIHSMTNFYPLLRHFNVRLKYICTKTSHWEQQLSPLFPGCSFTNDLQDILLDDSISGIFICASPESHYSILKEVLKSGKAVFVEKPPCITLSQLHDLVKITTATICKIGLQRRYWPGNIQALKKSREAASYVYQFQTGAYPQGDPFTELFLHPLDYCRFLFGESTLKSFSKHLDNRGLTLQLHITHPGNISGLLQLSTHYSWNPAFECLSVNGKKESLIIQYPYSVTGKPTPSRIMNIPAERLLRQPTIVKEYYSGGPSLIPALETNSYVAHGFLAEIETFITLVENSDAARPGTINDLPSLLGIYGMIEEMKK